MSIRTSHILKMAHATFLRNFVPYLHFRHGLSGEPSGVGRSARNLDPHRCVASAVAPTTTLVFGRSNEVVRGLIDKQSCGGINFQYACNSALTRRRRFGQVESRKHSDFVSLLSIHSWLRAIVITLQMCKPSMYFWVEGDYKTKVCTSNPMSPGPNPPGIGHFLTYVTLSGVSATAAPFGKFLRRGDFKPNFG